MCVCVCVMANFNPLAAQSVPVGSNHEGCVKIVKPDYVDCWECFQAMCGNNRDKGCYGDCSKPCGTCVELTVHGDLYTLTVYDPDGNVVEVIEGITNVTTSTGTGDDGHPFTRFHLFY